jgi:hypothetical protein
VLRLGDGLGAEVADTDAEGLGQGVKDRKPLDGLDVPLDLGDPAFGSVISVASSRCDMPRCRR